jgi:imidazolonepropionase
MNVYDSNRDLMRVRRAEWHDEYTDSTTWKYFQPQRGGHGAYFYRWSVKNEVEWKESFRILMTFLNEYKNRGGRVCAGSDSGFMYQVYGFGFVRELELFQEAGFSPLEVQRRLMQLSFSGLKTTRGRWKLASVQTSSSMTRTH